MRNGSTYNEPSYEVISIRYQKHKSSTDHNNESNKYKDGEKVKQKKQSKLPRCSSKTSSFYLDDFEEVYESMDDICKSNISIYEENPTSEKKNEPNYIDVETIEQIKNSLFLNVKKVDDHPYTEINKTFGKPRSSSIDQSLQLNKLDISNMRSRNVYQKDLVYNNSTYENNSPIKEEVHFKREPYVNHATLKVNPARRRTPSRSRSIPMRSKSMDCLLDIEFETSPTTQSVYEILPRPIQNPSASLNPPVQDKLNTLKRPSTLDIKQNYVNNELCKVDSYQLEGYESVNNIRKKTHGRLFETSTTTYGNLGSPNSETYSPEREKSLSYADIELDHTNPLLKRIEMKSDKSKDTINYDDITPYTRIDVQKSYGVSEAVKDLRGENEIGKKSAFETKKDLRSKKLDPPKDRKQRGYLTDLSHKTFPKKNISESVKVWSFLLKFYEKRNIIWP